jgi:hypothetical protein
VAAGDPFYVRNTAAELVRAMDEGWEEKIAFKKVS